MERHADFAASVAIRQSLLQDLITTLYHAGTLPHRLTGNQSGVSANLFLDVPTVLCQAVPADALVLKLQGWGELSITPPGGTRSTRTVLMRMTVFAPPLLSLSASTLTFRIDGPASTIQTLDVDPLVGGPYPAAAQAIIDSEAFKSGVQLSVQSMLGGMQRFAPPLSLAFLGPVASAPSASVRFRVVAGALAMGIDVTAAAGVTTTGNPNLLIDTTAGNDIGMWTNPAALPLVLFDVRSKVEAAVVQQGATLDYLTFALTEGAFHISGRADKGSEGSVTFSFDAVPRLVRPGWCEEWDEEYGEHFVSCTPSRDELWFELSNVDVDVNRPWWVVALEVLGAVFTFGIGTLAIEAIVEMVRNNVSAGINNAGGETLAARVREFTFVGLPEPQFRLEVAQYECHIEGVYSGLKLRPLTPAAQLEGPTSIAVDMAMASTLIWRVRLPFDVLADDPLLSVRWTVRRTDTNEILINNDAPALSNRSVDLSGLPALLVAPQLRIECRVYRTMGPVSTDLFTGTGTLQITDVLDRTHPFVRWDHYCYVPVVKVEPDGSKTQRGLALKQRHSRIHRTAVPGRCRMVSQYSLGEITVGTSPPPTLQYMDQLPFPIEDISSKRRVVCDYCFFGGPTRTTPLPL